MASYMGLCQIFNGRGGSFKLLQIREVGLEFLGEIDNIFVYDTALTSNIKSEIILFFRKQQRRSIPASCISDL